MSHPGKAEVYKDPEMFRSIDGDSVHVYLVSGAPQRYGDEEDVVKRIVACVNACRGIPTEALNKQAVADPR